MMIIVLKPLWGVIYKKQYKSSSVVNRFQKFAQKYQTLEIAHIEDLSKNKIECA